MSPVEFIESIPNKKLKNFLKNILLEINLPFEIKFVEQSELENLDAKFEFYLDDITKFTIKISRQLNLNFFNPDIEYIIAHEFVHPLLIFNKGYCYPIFVLQTPRISAECILYIINILDDIIVDKILEDNGFAPRPPKYFNLLKKSIEKFKGNEGFYRNLFHYQIWNLSTVCRYVIAWTSQKFYKLDWDQKNIINEFMKYFEFNYPKHFEIATAIIDIIKDNDIFNVIGHHITFKSILRLWNLDRFVKYKTIHTQL